MEPLYHNLYMPMQQFNDAMGRRFQLNPDGIVLVKLRDEGEAETEVIVAAARRAAVT